MICKLQNLPSSTIPPTILVHFNLHCPQKCVYLLLVHLSLLIYVTSSMVMITNLMFDVHILPYVFFVCICDSFIHICYAHGDMFCPYMLLPVYVTVQILVDPFGSIGIMISGCRCVIYVYTW